MLNINLNLELIKNKTLLFFLSILFFFTFLSIPLTEDVLVSFASSYQADFLGTFPKGFYNTWHLRGIGYKFLIYFIRISQEAITPNALNASSQIISGLYKIIYVFVVFILLVISFYSNKFILSWIKQRIEVPLLIILSLFGVSHWIFMQPEHFAIILTLFTFSLVHSKNKYLVFLSGFFLPILFSIKIITVLYFIFPFITFFAYEKNKQLKRIFFLSLFVAILGSILFYYFVIPIEIQDTLDAKDFQKSFVFDFDSFYRFFNQGVRSFSHIPFLYLILIFGFFDMKLLNLKEIFIIIIFIIISSCYLILQSQYFSYHFFIFLIPIYFLIYITANKFLLKPRIFVFCIAFVTFLFHFNTLTSFGIPIFKDKYASNKYYIENSLNPNSEISKKLKVQIENSISNTNEILYLTDGIISFYLKEYKSYSRYFFPLPIQRSIGRHGRRIPRLYHQEISKLLKYKGKFIILQPKWFEIEYFPDIKRKLESEYKINFKFKTKLNSHFDYILYEKIQK